MPTSVTFTYRYSLLAFGGYTTTSMVTSTTTLTDADGTLDGSTVPGDLMSSPFLIGNSGTYMGTTPDGGVVVEDDGAAYLFTDDATIPGGTLLTVNAVTYLYCYLAGTAIRTPTGERAVESLTIGDLVTTHDGRAVPVRWLGRQVRDARIAQLAGGMPVRIRRGALGSDAHGAPLPTRDLCVSPDHALLLDGLLIHAEALVNGSSITRVGSGELAQVAYYHIETADHELIIADGAPAETFIDNVSRAQFDNHAEWLALYPDAPAMRELPLGRVKLARQVPRRITERLAEIAATLPVTVTTATRVA